jgi:hypothetical protein
MLSSNLEWFKPFDEDDFHKKQSTVKEKVYFYGVGTVSFSISIYTGACLPYLAQSFPKMNLDTQLMFFTNSAAVTYPMLFPLFKRLSLKAQIDFLMVLSCSSIMITAFLVLCFPGSKTAYYAILLTNHLCYGFGCLGQSLAAKELTFKTSDLIPYLFFSYYSSSALSTLFGLVLNVLCTTVMAYYWWQMVPIAVLLVVTDALHPQICESEDYQIGLKQMDIHKEDVSVREIFRSLWKVIFETSMLVSIIFLNFLAFPNLILRLNPGFVTRSAWNNAIQFIGFSSIFIGSIVSSKWIKLSRWQTLAIFAVIIAFTMFICNQFMAQNAIMNDRN